MKKKFTIIAVVALLMTGCSATAETSDIDTAIIESTAEQTPSEVSGEKSDVRDILSPRERLGYEPSDSPDWVKALPQAETAEQLFVVAGYDTSSAWISMHKKDGSGNWKMIMSTPGFIGKDGLGKEKEGDGKTPQGEYHFNRAFGIADNPGCTAFPYVKATEKTYWSGDFAEGMQYNQLVENIDDLPGLDPDACEHIFDYPYEYQYCLNISYNEEGIPGLGSALFLHCLGSMKPRTGGCVAIPEDNMRYVMKHVDSECVVVIDTMEALGAEF